MSDWQTPAAQPQSQAKTKKLRFCPYDGNLLQPKNKYCSRCRRAINLQPMAPRKPRNFYEKMPDGVEDNYTDDLFLKGLVSKNSFPQLHFLPMIRETAEVINVLNALSCLITTFVYLHGVQNADVQVCSAMIVLLFASYMIHWRLNKDITWSGFFDMVGSFFFLSLVLAFLTPVLQSLTITYSSDTVTTLVVIFSIVHLWSYDFDPSQTFEPLKVPVVKSPKSLNAIFVAAILLSSRLSRFSSVFLLLFQSLVVFGFGPFFRQELRSFSREQYEVFTIVTTLFLFGFIFALNHLVGVIYLLSALGITLGGPLLFIYAYRFKNDIRGPWDLPKVKQLEHLS